jgi:cytochrome c556
MEAVQDALGPLRAMATGEAPFDAAEVEKHAEAIAANLTKAQDLFPEGSGGGDSRAKPEIWTDREAFDGLMTAAIEAATAMAAVSEEAALEPAMRELGGSCRSCHQDYRLPRQ